MRGSCVLAAWPDCRARPPRAWIPATAWADLPPLSPIREAQLAATCVAVGTHAGEEVRVRMMHPGAFLPDDETARPIVYLASMTTDPKIREVTTPPEVALLPHEPPTDAALGTPEQTVSREGD